MLKASQRFTSKERKRYMQSLKARPNQAVISQEQEILLQSFLHNGEKEYEFTAQHSLAEEFPRLEHSDRWALFEQLLIHLFLITIIPQGFRQGPPEQIDRAWRAFILYNSRYNLWCEHTAGSVIPYCPEAVIRAKLLSEFRSQPIWFHDAGELEKFLNKGMGKHFNPAFWTDMEDKFVPRLKVYSA
jgi:hypothetical protein